MKNKQLDRAKRQAKDGSFDSPQSRRLFKQVDVKRNRQQCKQDLRLKREA